MIYAWKPGTAIAALDAQTAGERLEAIRVTHGGFLTPAQVVADARTDDSPLHPVFEWVDARAAERWREEQASYLIRHITVVVERQGAEDDSPPIFARAFVSVQFDDPEGDEPTQAYTAISVALQDGAMREQVVQRAYSELQAWRRRYADLKELAQVFEALDAATAQGAAG
jgi:hypothetical protein